MTTAHPAEPYLATAAVILGAAGLSLFRLRRWAERKKEKTLAETKPIGIQSRRLKRLIVSWELVHDFLTAGEHSLHYVVANDPIPEDAVLVNAQHAWPNCVELLIYSASFEEVKEGGQVPTLSPTLKRAENKGEMTICRIMPMEHRRSRAT